MSEVDVLHSMQVELDELRAAGNLRTLPHLIHRGKRVVVEGEELLNVSSNDYLGLSSRTDLKAQFLETVDAERFLPTSSSSRLLTGNYSVYDELEQTLAQLYGTEAALVFDSGYHANTGIIPAVSDEHTLLLADKLVHASMIDGIRLSTARCVRYRHNNYEQLEELLRTNAAHYERVIILTESIFSMDGDTADLRRLVALKRSYPNVLLYLDEAHGIGVRGETGLGLAQEQGCLADIDFWIGTFGKAVASAGACIVCRRVVRDWLVNKMRPFIFTTALPPINVQWTLFVLRRMASFTAERAHLDALSRAVADAVRRQGLECLSQSHIVPLLVGQSALAIEKSMKFRQHGFYCLPVRPPTVPEGTSRIRLSLTAAMTSEEVAELIKLF